MFKDMKYGTFILFGLVDVVIAIAAFFLVRETKGQSLEEASSPAVFNRDCKLVDNDSMIEVGSAKL